MNNDISNCLLFNFHVHLLIDGISFNYIFNFSWGICYYLNSGISRYFHKDKILKLLVIILKPKPNTNSHQQYNAFFYPKFEFSKIENLYLVMGRANLHHNCIYWGKFLLLHNHYLHSGMNRHVLQSLSLKNTVLLSHNIKWIIK